MKIYVMTTIMIIIMMSLSFSLFFGVVVLRGEVECICITICGLQVRLSL